MDSSKPLLSVRSALRKVSQRFLSHKRGPIARFPTEILVCIFEIATTNDPQTSVIISHTSRRWRDIALDLSYLWSIIDLGWKEEKVSAFLIRSKNELIEIRLDDTLHDNFSKVVQKAALERLQRSLNLASRQSERWHSFRYVSSESSPFATILANNTSNLNTPKLTNLRVPESQYMTLFHPPPALRSLELDTATNFQHTYINANILSQLTNITCGISNGRLSFLFHHSPTLRIISCQKRSIGSKFCPISLAQELSIASRGSLKL